MPCRSWRPFCNNSVLSLETPHQVPRLRLRICLLLDPSRFAQAKQTHTDVTCTAPSRLLANLAKTVYCLVRFLQPTFRGDSLTSKSAKLIDELKMLQKSRKDHLTLAEAAFNFKSHLILSKLMQETAQVQGRSPWADVHHLIGRLGAWRRTARTLVSFACHFPQIIQDHAVQFLRVPSPTPAPAADRKTNLESALRRMLSSQDVHRANDLNEALEKLRGFDVPEAFEKKYCARSFMPHIHAEVYLLEHFYFGRMKFLERDRYVGCSKPSCYCCGLYMRFHPGNVAIRPCSGNVWTHWSPPIEVKSGMEQGKWKHTLDIMNAMNNFIRRDVIEEIETRAPRGMRMPDTTTGFSTAGSVSRFSGEDEEAKGISFSTFCSET